MESIWSKTVELPKFAPLQGDLDTEAVVIGGGLAGLLTAYALQQRNVKTVVLEAARIGSGQTKGTTAKITLQHDIIYSKIKKDFGEEKARQYALANQQAIDEYRRLVNEKHIECSFRECPAYLYSPQQQDVQRLEEETAVAKELGIRAEFTTQTTLPFSVAGAMKFEGQACFNPLAFLQPLSKELTIFEHTPVTTVEENRVVTKNGTVTAKHIVFACHFPFLNMPGFYFARMHQDRSYVLALENVPMLDGMYLGIDTEALSFRNYDGLLLFGGGDHRTGENSAGGKYEFLRQRAAQLYPQSKETLRWSAQDCITLDGIPYIGQFSSSTPHWYVATGFAKWGMTSSMVSARLIADSITGVENPCAEVFSPQRFTPTASMRSFVTDMGQAVKGISRRAFQFPQENAAELPIGHGGIVEYNKEKVGVYKDEQGRVFAVSVRCPHLGCQLEWNPDEKSWDCPCHGSRFDYQGNLIGNPAQCDLERMEHE